MTTIRPFGGNDYVFGNSGDDVVAHSYGDDRIFGGCGSDTVRGGFGFDRIYANMPDTWFDMSFVCSRDGNVNCAPVTTSESSGLPLTLIQITTLAEAAGNDVDDSPSAHDLVDCAWLGSRGDEGLEDVGFGQPANAVAPAVADTVVDCSNRDDQAPR